ncbi:hypothetical protein BBF96_14580 [Anoxybacter fermentans]|uniref:SHS2 domain-containing protein n=1 Tax=Anoxybacter fermentans TaxID=1323375 RepID=A0A3Q9HS39_9FIRM|nr:type IV pilus assembly protein PilM [Anoxybacter fermentans]AZR74503.1 hypothetical protein BBF96_14580 [Anoxybacter fermentans]
MIKNTYLGIDVGSRNIKGIKLKRTLKGFKIVDMVVQPISRGAVRQGLFHDLNLAVNLFRELKDRLKIGGQGVYLAFSGQHAIIREVEMPVMTDRELSKAIYWEAKKVLPYSVEEAIIDWIVLERRREIDKMMSVLLVAGRKDYIYSFLKPIKSVGIKPQNLSIFPIPLLYVVKQIPDFKKYTTAAVIDMGAEVTHVLIIKDGLPRLSRTIPIGGNDFTEAIANSFSIPFDEAEEVKIEHGGLNVQEIDLNKVNLMENPYLGVEEILYSVAQDVMGEVKRSFVHFQLHNRGQQIEAVYLTGGSSLLPGMAEHLQQFLNISVFPLDLTQYFSFAEDLEDRLKREGIFMAEALGLALSGV